METQRLPVTEKAKLIFSFLLPPSQQKINPHSLPAILRRHPPPSSAAAAAAVAADLHRPSSKELDELCASAAAAVKLRPAHPQQRGGVNEASPMLSLQSPRCRLSLPVALAGSAGGGGARSLPPSPRPGASRRVGCGSRGLRRKAARVRSVGKEEAELRAASSSVAEEEEQRRGEDEDVDPQDLEYVGQIRRVLELLKKNRDMIFSEVKLTIMIEDPREVERRRLLGIEDLDAPTREDLAEALEQVNEGKVPENRLALKMLAEEMIQWPNLEEAIPKKKPGKSLYAKATDTGINPEVAAKRLNIDWDSAAEIEEDNNSDETEVPPAVGYGALYLVTAFPVIIGISVVLILFYNSLQ